MHKLSTPLYLTGIPNDPEKELKKLKRSMVLIFAIIAFIYIYNTHLLNSLMRNGILLQAKTFSITQDGKHGPRLNFTFQIKQQSLKGSSPLPTFNNNEERERLVNKTFPLFVDTTDFTNYKLFSDSLSMVNYGLEYSKTLRWIKKFSH